MNKDIEIAMDDFYRLKQEYERDVETKRDRIKRDKTLSKEQKRQRLSQIVSKCVNCAKPGGTLFSTDKGTLRARCGAVEPCQLNIEIIVSRVENLTKLYTDLSFLVRDLKKDIIRTKLDLLFGYTNENKALGEFNKVRDELKIAQNYFDETEHTYFNIVHNKRNIAAINVVEEQLFTSKERLRELARQYDEDGTEQLIQDMVEVYTSDISPLVTRLRTLKYAYNGIECGSGEIAPCEDDIYHLVQNTYSAQELEVKDSEMSEAIIANVK
jgi:hypothetical protein